jgi:hypothetical protein
LFQAQPTWPVNRPNASIFDWVGEDTGEQQARVAAVQVGPVALTFEAEHPSAGLPAIADLATGRAAGCVVTTFVADEGAGHRDEIPAATA